MLTQWVLPGSRHSQKSQPLTEFFVMAAAAGEGDSKRWPLYTSAPSSTRAVYVWPR
jgi:hypothetical protein